MNRHDYISTVSQLKHFLTIVSNSLDDAERNGDDFDEPLTEFTKELRISNNPALASCYTALMETNWEQLTSLALSEHYTRVAIPIIHFLALQKSQQMLYISPLEFVASSDRYTALLKAMLDSPYRHVNAPGKWRNESLLIVAVSSGQTENVRVLLSTASSSRGWASSFVRGCRSLMAPITNAVLGAAKDAVDRRMGEFAWAAAIKMFNQGYADVTHSLFKAANTVAINPIVKASYDLLIHFMVSREVDVNQDDDQQMTALMHAVDRGHVAIVQDLLAHPGADVNKLDSAGSAAIIHASERNNPEVLRSLLQNENVNVNQQDRLGRTALMHVIDRGFIPQAKLLLFSRHTKLDIVDNQGRTACTVAKNTGNQEIEILLNNKSSFDAFQMIVHHQRVTESATQKPVSKEMVRLIGNYMFK